MRTTLAILSIWCLAFNATAQPYRNEWIDYNKVYYKFPVSQDRLVRISKTVLQAAGVGNVPAEQFQLWRNGEEVALYTTEPTGALSSNGFIEFLGRRNDGKPDTELYDVATNQVNSDYSYFSDTAWYYLTVNASGNNKRILKAANNVGTTTLPADSFYMHNYRNYFFYTWSYGSGSFVASLTRPDRTFGEVFRTSALNGGEGWSSQAYNTEFPLTYEVANLKVYSKGPAMQASVSISGNYQLTRNVNITLNDSLVLNTFVNWFDMVRDTINNLPTSLIKADKLKVKFSSDNPYYWDNAYTNVFSLVYPHTFSFDGASFANFSLPANTKGNHLRLHNFGAGGMAPIVYDLTNGLRYESQMKGDSTLVQLAPTSSNREIAIANQAASMLQVNALVTKQFVNFSLLAEQGNYLIVTNKVLRRPLNGEDQIEAYKNYRSSAKGGGYNAKVYDINELAEQFAFGMQQHPLAIKNFVRFANAKFAAKPQYLYLIGKATYFASLRVTGNFAGKSDISLLPTFGLPASDNMLVSTSNLNPTIIIPLGRLSAVSPDDVKLYLDKVKDYEALQQKPGRLAGDGDWQKNMVHLIGGDSVFLSNYIGLLMNSYRRSVAAPPIAANVFTSRKASNPNFQQESVVLDSMLNKGVGLLTYFGHSSSSSIDYGLNKPEQYNNDRGKYPVFLANGCLAGNIFDFSTNRLLTKNISLSENYVFAPNKGAIAVIANSYFGEVNALHTYTKEWYTAFGNTKFGKSIGQLHQEALFQAYQAYRNPTNPDAAIGRYNLEQMVIQGDPAIVPFPYQLPDYTTSAAQITSFPGHPTSAEDSVWVTVKFSNIGKAVSDTVDVIVKRELPNGNQQILWKSSIANLYQSDSVKFKIGLNGLFEAGKNYIIAEIDPDGRKTELSKINNVGKMEFEMNTNLIKPVFPYHLSIVNKTPIRFVASTIDPTAKPATYRIQVDTSRLFNSPLLFTADTTSLGGALAFEPNLPWQPNTVYYWRTSPVNFGQAAKWEHASFVVLPNSSEGFNQSHYFQHSESIYTKLKQNPQTRAFEFGPNPQNIFIEHGIYNTSGTENSHFSVSVNGSRIIESACIGQSIIFNVFDSLTFRPWSNPNSAYGSAAYCDYGREFNFEFNYFDHRNRKKIMDFLKIIPKGNYVVARLVVDAPYDSLQVKYWKNDTLIYGKGNSLYHALYNQGFYGLDSLNRTRTFGFVFKKDDSARFSPFYTLSDGIFDRITSSVNVFTLDTAGQLLSPKAGPAKAWNQLTWQSMPAVGNANPATTSVDIIGVQPNGSEVKLRSLPLSQNIADVSGINANTYPYLRMQFNTSEKVFSKPDQLNLWRLNYLPVADGALSAKDHFEWRGDTLFAERDSLVLGLAFKNISAYPLAATQYKLWLGDNKANETLVKQGALKSLQAGDTAIIRYAATINNKKGNYYLRLVVNEERQPTEQAWFNNLAYLPLFIDTAKVPVALIDFKVIPIANNIDAIWNVKDEWKVNRYELMYGLDTLNMSTVYTQLPLNNGAASTRYTNTHTTPIFGKNYYRLKIIDRYGVTTITAAQLVDVNFGDFAAKPLAGKIGFNWNARNEIKVKQYNIEHTQQLTGNWKVVSSQAGTNSGAALLSYTAAHLSPSLGMNWYRLHVEDQYGKYYYSQVDSVKISILDFNAVGNSNAVAADWIIGNEINIANYQLEESRDSVRFTTVSTVLPGAGGAGQVNYSSDHSGVAPGIHYYRLKVTDKNGNIAYSVIKKVFVGDQSAIFIFPNPFNSIINVVMADVTNSWNLWLFDAQGKLVMAKTGRGSIIISTASLPKGTYLLKFQKGTLTQIEKLIKH